MTAPPSRGSRRPHPADVARDAAAPYRRAADGLLRAVSYAGRAGDLSRLRTGDAAIRTARATFNLLLAEVEYCHGDRRAAIAGLEAARLEIHREAGALIGPPWEFGSTAAAAAADVRRALHAIEPARRALPPMRHTSYGTAAATRRRHAGPKTASPKAPRPRRRPE